MGVLMTTDEEIAALNGQINLLNRTISDVMRERRKAEKKIFELRNPPPTNAMLRLAGRHVTDAVMVTDHVIDEADIMALRKIIDALVTRLDKEDSEA
jgi:hypothetical protein